MPRLRTGGAPRSSYQRVSLDLGDVILIQQTILNARQDFIAAGDQATAQRAAVIFDRFVTRIRDVAVRTAEVAEREIKAALDATQVRPDTGRGGPKLRNLITAEAWDPTPSVATGTVLMGILEELDKVPYWRAQEFGHHYSHTPKGFFFGPGYQGAFMPNPMMSRQHPLFMPSGKGRKFMSPPSIDARHYLRDGSAAAVAYWQQHTATAVGEAATELRRLLARRGRGVVPTNRRRRP